ncbi:hypothetical protein Ahy_A01g001878 [Arachis hypogaea]|uniref:Uncharacterized protein n=2 Tax=Arachis TaxID=3817 RepID=A0A445EPM3_ARAHY|nr:hypothetical protein Ahy_A01g001878 [Arachis hypogaea]
MCHLSFKMGRKGRYTKKPKLRLGCQQLQTAPPPASASHRDDSQILPDSGDSVPTTSHSLDQEAGDPFVDTSAQSRKGHKTIEFWEIKIIDSDGTIKPTKLSVRVAMERLNDRKIVLKFNNANQAIGDEAGLLSACLQIFYFDEVSERTIKKNILKSTEKAWKETRLRLYNDYYEPTFTNEQNIERCPPGNDREHWRWFLDYRAKAEIKEKCKKNTINQSKQLYTHTGGSKSFARRMEEEVLYLFIHSLEYFYDLSFLDCVEYNDGINFVDTVETTREMSR